MLVQLQATMSSCLDFLPVTNLIYYAYFFSFPCKQTNNRPPFSSLTLVNLSSVDMQPSETL